MNIEQLRLFELQIKGDRLDQINAEEALAHRACWRWPDGCRPWGNDYERGQLR